MLSEVRRLLLWVPPLVWMVLIFRESSLSDPAPAVTAVVWDKALHAGAYAVLGVLLARALVGEGWPWRRAAIGAIVIAALYGASDEVHQIFTPMREADILDWVADAIGSTAGGAVYGLWRRGRGGAEQRRV